LDELIKRSPEEKDGMESGLVVNVNKFVVERFNHIAGQCDVYRKRLESLSLMIIPKLEPPVIQRISDIVSGVRCSILGVVTRRGAKRFSSVKQTCHSGDDFLSLWDSGGDVRLAGIDPAHYVSGVVIGVTGELQENVFSVIFVRVPGFEPISAALASSSCKIVFISNLMLDSREFDLEAGQKLISWINSDKTVDLVVVIGSTFGIPDSEMTDEDWELRLGMTEISPLAMFSQFFNGISCGKLIIPGKFDPVEGMFPQGSFIPAFCEGVDLLECASNPAWFAFNEITFLCSSGEPIWDIVRETGMSFGDAELCVLNWRLIAPTTPSNFGSYLNETLILTKMPRFFLCGGASQTFCSEVKGVFVIGVDDFSVSRSVVVIDLNSGEVESRSFR
jgi:hypothetical protein